jgi:hypothetical protein
MSANRISLCSTAGEALVSEYDGTANHSRFFRSPVTATATIVNQIPNVT